MQSYGQLIISRYEILAAMRILKDYLVVLWGLRCILVLFCRE